MDVIKFLESAGNTVMDADDYVAAVGTLDVGDAARAALVAGDGGALGKLLGGRDTMYCSVLAPDHEDAPVMPEEPGEEPDSESDVR